MKSLKLLFAVAAMLIIGAVSSNAQQVAGTFGLGFNVGEYSGIQGHYSVNNDFELGSQFGLSSGGSSTNFLLAPYAKLRFSGNNFRPYVIGQFSIVSSGGNSANFLDGRLGAEYFANPAVAIMGDVSVISLGLGSGGTTVFGVLNPRVGVNWYFK